MNKELIMEKIILSIDGATKTGWAIYKDGRIILHGTKKFIPQRRYIDYFRWLMEIITKYKITHIVAEDIFREHSRTMDNAFYVLSKMQGVLECAAGINGKTITLLNPLQVKNNMIPSLKPHNRKNDKIRMINRVNFLGYQLETEKSDDEADAIGILITYLDNNNIPVNHPKNSRMYLESNYS